MELNLVSLKADCKDRKYFEQLNEEAFPPSERMDMQDIFAFEEATNTDLLGIYDGKVPVGFSLLLKNDRCAYLYYLAIDQNFRSQGYGAMALKKIIERYPELQIILDFEELEPDAENLAQRIRRKGFYLRNGFHETGTYTKLWEQRFEVVCSGGEFRREAFQDLLYILHEHREEFPDRLF